VSAGASSDLALSMRAGRVRARMEEACQATVALAASAQTERERRERNRKAFLLAFVVGFIFGGVAAPHLSEVARAIGTGGAVLLVGVYAAVRLALEGRR
jgi:hypothetical protein